MHNLSERTILEFKHRIKTGSTPLNIKVSDAQTELMVEHAKELMLWNKRTNLTAIRQPLQMAEKHFLDSMAVLPFLTDRTRLIDLGSGGGFPGIPIKIMNPRLTVVLIDSSRKKVNFLKQVIRTLQLKNIQAIHSRVEDLHADKAYQNQFDAVISRAFTDLSGYAAFAAPFLNHRGIIYAMKGKQARSEITPEVSEGFDIQSTHYQLPFEKSDRYLIKLSAKG